MKLSKDLLSSCEGSSLLKEHGVRGFRNLQGLNNGTLFAVDRNKVAVEIDLGEFNEFYCGGFGYWQIYDIARSAVKNRLYIHLRKKEVSNASKRSE